MAKKLSQFIDSIKGYVKAVGQMAKTRTITGRKKRPPTPSQKSGKGGKPKKKAAKKGRARAPRASAQAFLKKVDPKLRKRLAKRGVIKLTKAERSNYYRLNRLIGAKKRLSKADRATWDRLSKKVLHNKIAGSHNQSLSKKNSRRSKSNSKGRRNKVIDARKATVARGKRKGRNSKK